MLHYIAVIIVFSFVHLTREERCGKHTPNLLASTLKIQNPKTKSCINP